MAETAEAQAVAVQGRTGVLVDVCYILLTVYLYISSLLVPLLGIVVGLFLLLGGAHLKTRSVGKVCLALGLVNLVVLFVGGGALGRVFRLL